MERRQNISGKTNNCQSLIINCQLKCPVWDNKSAKPNRFQKPVRFTVAVRGYRGETLPARQYIHNRRSATCGEGSSRQSLPERQDFLSCLSGSITLRFPCRWSSTIGYENYVLSGLYKT
ncbi:MAG: hypothetical protein LBJ63_02295 [Prevotellaceae bacterium]|nr:hypothetical protein [Prevotellaceae bacterium]